MAKQPRSLEQLLTFDRGSAAGYFGRDGKYVWQEKNRNLSPPMSLWSATANLTKKQSTVPAPDGSLMAWEFTENTTGTVSTNFASPAFSYSGTTCSSVFIYAPDHPYIWMRHGGSPSYIFWNRETGAVTYDNGTNSRPTFSEVGDGWVRISGTKEGTGTQAFQVGVSDVSDTVAGTTLAGRTFYVWGGQIELAEFPTPYVAPGYSPRIEWTSGERKGLLIEGASTNLVIHSEGDRSTYGLSAGSANGGPRWGFANWLHLADNDQQRDALKSTTRVAGTTYTSSFFIEMDDGGVPTSDDFLVFNTGGIFDFRIEHIFGSLYRVVSDPHTPASNASSYSGVRKLTSQSARGFRISGFQLEAKPYATSYIPTTTAQVTRAADVAKIEGAALSSWLQQGQGTLFVGVSGKGLSDSLSAWALALSDGTINNRIGIYTSASLTRGYVGTNGAPQAIIPGPGLTGEPVKMALSYGPNDVAFAQEGSLVGTDTSAAISQTVDQLTLGAAYNNISHLDGHIRDFRFFPTRLSNEALQALTAP